MTIRVLAFAGSLRKDSWNRKLIALGAAAVRGLGADVDLLDLREVDMPLYDGDLEAASGLPAGALAFRDRIAKAAVILIASPEYNYSIPGTLKNAIDWTSRPPQQPWQGKVVGLMAASPGAVGGARMLPDLRKVLSGIGALVVPSQVSVGGADKAFDAEGKLGERPSKQIDALAKQLLDLAGKLHP